MNYILISETDLYELWCGALIMGKAHQKDNNGESKTLGSDEIVPTTRVILDIALDEISQRKVVIRAVLDDVQLDLLRGLILELS